MLISVVCLWLLTVSVSSSGIFEKFSYVQQFAKPVFNAKEKENIGELENFLSELWKLDKNRMDVGEDIEVKVPKSVNLLSYFKPTKDELFQFVSKGMLNGPTYEAFIHLLDNYNANAGHTEYTTYEQMQEIWAFLHAISETAVIKHTHEFLACSDKPHFLSVYFESTKTGATMNGAYVLLGTSPEFELAAYTTVFLMGLPGKLTVNGCSIYLVCTRQLFDKRRPRTCYPKDQFL
ncbi:hypothetical protein T265_06185 [Opisthorchis viverrini]|uniref:Uridylate-specific endoribonuclease n=1 Tax=Opisthorchis viverrini TaxID=6198 RepID=A0A074ZHB8_OPIVI|nr:hypothetical protein T265_06185 [Opisthorchis viverrini]KER26613.1 hypothetical protein T265_06185 [Opisthorchis viverrini]